jgi:hypothetical protein
MSLGKCSKKWWITNVDTIPQNAAFITVINSLIYNALTLFKKSYVKVF